MYQTSLFRFGFELWSFLSRIFCYMSVLVDVEASHVRTVIRHLADPATAAASAFQISARTIMLAAAQLKAAQVKSDRTTSPLDGGGSFID